MVANGRWPVGLQATLVEKLAIQGFYCVASFSWLKLAARRCVAWQVALRGNFRAILFNPRRDESR